MESEWVDLKPEEIKNISMATEFKEIPGLSVLNDAITESDEKKIIAKIEKGVWESVAGKREVQQFGFKYDYVEKCK